MRRALLGLAAAIALAAPANAAAEDFSITMPGKYFDPARVTIVTGDQVLWRNADFVAHDVRATNGAFDSGVLGPRGFYAHRFDSAGSYPLICTLHPFMTGGVEVVGATLSGPPGGVVAGEPVRLQGRAATGTATVQIQARQPDGSWRPAGFADAGADGSFAFTTSAERSGTYRAVTAAGASPAVTVNVVAHVALSVRARRGRVAVRVSPAQKSLVASLQRYSRERFMWRRIAHARTDRRGAAEFRLRSGLRGTVRVLLSRAPGAPAIGTSRALRLRDGRMVPDPGPKPGGHGMG